MKIKSLKIIAKTENGIKAIKSHIDTTKTKEMHMARLLGYKQQVISLEPFTLLVTLNWQLQRLIKQEDLTRKIKEAMKQNKAKYNQDYIIVVEE